jgi:hypothetical protein
MKARAVISAMNTGDDDEDGGPTSRDETHFHMLCRIGWVLFDFFDQSKVRERGQLCTISCDHLLGE